MPSFAGAAGGAATAFSFVTAAGALGFFALFAAGGARVFFTGTSTSSYSESLSSCSSSSSSPAAFGGSYGAVASITTDAGGATRSARRLRPMLARLVPVGFLDAAVCAVRLRTTDLSACFVRDVRSVSITSAAVASAATSYFDRSSARSSRPRRAVNLRSKTSSSRAMSLTRIFSISARARSKDLSCSLTRRSSALTAPVFAPSSISAWSSFVRNSTEVSLVDVASLEAPPPSERA
mmetsp:Transcript_5567/g.20266  ORF Transcript_5567/g.20266 Transcript_5567/m.20266 type:complete len:236 (+) Transcript_5567:496-1203(+)